MRCGRPVVARPTRPTATIRDLEGRPLERDAYAGYLRRRMEAERGRRLPLLDAAEAQAVAALLDELSGVWPDEELGALARELAVRLYDRTGI